MEEVLLPLLKKHTLRIVKDASQPGGSMDKGEFTMAVARRRIEEAMGFEEGELAGLWKQVVKDVVKEAMARLEEESQPEAGSSKSPSSSPSPFPSSPARPSKRSKAKVKPKGTLRQSAPKPWARSTSPTSSAADEDEREPEHWDEALEVDDQNGRDEERPINDDESDMSSVYDVPPSGARSRQKSSKDAKKKISGGSKRRTSKAAFEGSSEDEEPRKSKSVKRQKKDPNEGLSPDEAKVADLKRIVVACGVRKQWGKEFADCPTTSSQISHLKSLLISLGMKGQPTIGKAKSLKMKRELAQELDDVKSFEAARGLSSNGRERRTRGSISKSKIADPDDSDGTQGTPPDEDKEKSALGAVMDFLGGDSDSE
ncbi:hypothetical protein I316_04492 [Kwoniella heveanensis BCC8398]|uniref:DEK C-terminal domain-containing protein n=1 Tax=Kwoniella heveanensis BCC8398 TaxID=1296120 RepID=A0A1B9GRT1_9TREE|nr:hypothetical protein I316_04492 [Kwoniella heveanensis BCC8398]